MNKKQIALGVLAATFCASTMTSGCGSGGNQSDVYGPPERYHEYEESKAPSESPKNENSNNEKKGNDVKESNSPTYSPEDDSNFCEYGPPEES